MHTSSVSVVAIAAPIGGGKSALCRRLAATLQKAPLICFDDYETASKLSASEIQIWLSNGADFDFFEAPGLVNRLQDLIVLNSSGPIVFEMPLGRAWKPTREIIGTLVWLDVPQEVALARRIKEIVQDLRTASDADVSAGLAWLNAYLEQYNQTIRHVLNEQYRVIRPMADLILDGTDSVESNVAKVLHFLDSRK